MESLRDSFQNQWEIGLQSSQFAYGNLKEFLSTSMGIWSGKLLVHFHMGT